MGARARLGPRPAPTSFLALAGFLVLGACTGAGPAPASAPPGAPGPAGSGTADAQIAPRPPHTEADIAFMQGMIGHHRQALEMAALVDERTPSESIRLLAERIEVSQTDEIEMMSRWLEGRGAAVPAADDHAHHGAHAAMPGMLSPEEMASLAATQGAAFDRLFLELMIRHHEGALVMVGELLGTPGSGQDVDVFRIASEIDSDQRIEIERMQRMLSTQG